MIHILPLERGIIVMSSIFVKICQAAQKYRMIAPGAPDSPGKDAAASSHVGSPAPHLEDILDHPQLVDRLVQVHGVAHFHGEIHL